ncbi:MAG: hemerythrin domain-containing protein [Kofleriaceae bacterium]|nr:hemerythrin domain-containing protein [Myxococcales bacterium]MCB9565356.1 hemerythrin domain-containing protein [Kofleriaceae bacterium]
MTPPGSVRQFLEDQHELLELRLVALERAVRAHALTDAGQRLAGFRGHLARYVRTEERLLFPMYDHVAAAAVESTATATPTARMRDEHAGLGRLVAEIGGLLARGDADTSLLALGTLRSLLLVHGTKEAWIIYPRVAGALSTTMEDALVSDLRAGVPLAC